MKKRMLNKTRNRFINEYKKLKRRNPDGNHKLFFTFDYLGYSDFCDCYFVGKFRNNNVLFNAGFSTLRLHAENIVLDLVSNKMDELFPDRFDNHFDLKEIIDFNEWFNAPEEKQYKDWPLEQKYQAEEERIRQSILEAGIEVQPYVEVLPDYEFGVGLHGVFDCYTFEKQNVIEIINCIKAYHLTEYSKPIFFGDKKKLFSSDLDQIQHSTPLILKSNHYE